VTNAQSAQSGYYSVIVSNASGSVTNQVARLKLFLPTPTAQLKWWSASQRHAEIGHVLA
jgi:hypothetical protein